MMLPRVERFTRGCASWRVVPVVLLFAACAATVQEVDTQTARRLLPWLTEQTPREIVLKRLGQFWKYRDDAGRILIYSVEPKGQDALRVWQQADSDVSYELVIVFNEQDRVDRFRLLKVK